MGISSMKFFQKTVKRKALRLCAIGIALIALQIVLFLPGIAESSSPANSAYDVPDGAYGTPDNYYFPWYDSKPEHGMNGNWILMNNKGGITASVDIYIGGSYRGNYQIPSGQEQLVQYANTMDGPVKVMSSQPLLVSQRVIYKGSFNEVLGVREDNLGNNYYFPWYDSKPEHGMNGNWIMIANPSSTTANIKIYAGDLEIDSLSIPGNGRVTQSYFSSIGGPIHVVCTNGINVICSQRVLYLDSFSEVMGVTSGSLSAGYNFTWYDSLPQNGMNGNWIMAANASSSDSRVQICLFGACTDPNDPGAYLLPGEITVGSFSGPDGGYMAPDVEVFSPDNKELIVSQRVLYKNSFSEVMGVPDWKLSSGYGFTWYDQFSPGMNSWLIAINKGYTATRLQFCFMGQCVEISEPDGKPMWLNAGDILVIQIPGFMGGPLSIHSSEGNNLMVSQRVLYWNSFEEIQGATTHDTGSLYIFSTPSNREATDSVFGTGSYRAGNDLAGKLEFRRAAPEDLETPDLSALFEKP